MHTGVVALGDGDVAGLADLRQHDDTSQVSLGVCSFAAVNLLP
jgi:hypothetical protein